MKPAPLSPYEQHLHRLETLKGELRAHERRAGISEAVDQWARSGTESFYGLREIVFAVPDEGIRSSLIDKTREIDAEGDRRQQLLVDDARADLAEAEGKGAKVPWVLPSVLAILGVWIGWSIAAIPGAIGGGLVAWFAAQAYLGSVRTHHRQEVALAAQYLQTTLDDQKRDEEESRHDPRAGGAFSLNESVTLEPDATR